MAKIITTYTDGSWSSNSPDTIGWGWYSNDQQYECGEINAADDKMDTISGHQVGGELAAAIFAIEYAIKNQYDEIILRFDYLGVEAWPQGQWTPKKTYTKAYVGYIKQARQFIKITFQKVSADDAYHKRADELARSITGAKCRH